MRRALIAGIDDYPNQSLQGCVNDAIRMESVLAKNEDDSPNFDCRLITAPGDQINRSSLRRSLIELFQDPADIAWFHFSGHGYFDGLDGYLVTQDSTTYDEGIPMAEILNRANNAQISEILITLDCCHSGAFGNPTLGNQINLGEGISVVTATRAGQASLEVGGGGVFTSLLVEALEGGAAGILGDITAAGIYAYIDSALGAWDQRPQFRANVSRFTQLRSTNPRLPLTLLHNIPTLFPVPAEEFPLDPSYEPSEDPRSEDNEKIFSDLQKLKACGLVEPIDEDHMYFAAINSTGCKLTKLGLYYWRLVNDSRI